MSRNILGLKIPATMTTAFALFAVTLLTSPVALAAVHNIALSAEVLPNGQYAYKRDGQAVIPGPTLFVKQGDTIHIALTNHTPVSVGLKVPGLSKGEAKTAANGGTHAYSFTATKTGTYTYHGDGPELLGLFGAIVVDRQDGKVEGLVDDNGAIKSVDAIEVTKQYVLFMVGSTFWGTEISKTGVQTPLWTNPILGAVENDIVRFHVLSVGPGHTFHLHAHRWIEPGTTSIIDTKLLADGAASHSFLVKAGTGVGPGNWQYHCHLFSHMEAGMHGSFRVDSSTPGPNFGTGTSIAGASPSGAIFGNASTDPGLVTFIISDEPGSWFRSTRGDALAPTTISKSLEIIPPGSSVNFIMSDTNTVHTITSLLYPTGAATSSNALEHPSMPFSQTRAYRGGGIVKLTTPGLYVFTCKVHPYMFGAVIVDDSATTGLDLGEGIDIPTIGVTNLPTTSNLAAVLLKTFFVATAPSNWQNFSSSAHWTATYSNVDVRVTTGAVANLHSYLTGIFHTSDVALTALSNPATPGVGEVWVNTQFEKTAGKTKPGTITVIDAANWSVKRKIALPRINMNNPHNMWPSHDQSVVYQTQWFDNKLTMINKKSGAMIKNIQVGDAPAHVMTNPLTGDIIVSNNGEDGMSIILAGTTKVSKMMPTQGHGQASTNPHGHWISADGSRIVTPNINTGDVGVYDTEGVVINRAATGTIPGAHPIAIGMMPDSSKVYASNLLQHSLSVLNGNTGSLIKTINLIANYNPVSGAIGGDGTVGILPIQTPVSPDGKAVVLANTGGMILIIDTATDTIVKMLPCGPGCHGANFGAKQGGGYYAYVTSKFANNLIVVDVDPNGDGNLSDAAIVGRISLVASASTPKDDTISGLAGFGGNGVLAIPNVYNGWVQKLPDTWKEKLTEKQKNPI